jgi:hypothetical protein
MEPNTTTTGGSTKEYLPVETKSKQNILVI